jgi:redox-sensing transcriptional repressor
MVRMKKKISLRVSRRILFYYEAMLKLNLPDDTYISSKKLEEVTGVSCNQIRQDFFYLGISIGKQKKGYQVKKLFNELKKLLSIEKGARMIIIGAGRIGQALADYKLFRSRNITVAALFDIKKDLIDTMVGRLGEEKPILHIDQLEDFLGKNPDIRIAMITVPEESAQMVLDRLMAKGVKGVVNFAPKILRVPKEAKNVILINDCIGSSLYKVIYQCYHTK